MHPDDASKDFSGPTLSPQQVQQWRQAGYALLNGVLPQSLVARVQEQARSAFTKLAKCQEPGDGLGFPFLNTSKHGQLDAANEVPLHPRLLTAVSQLLGVPVDDIMLGQAELWCKVGEAAGEGGWAPLQNQDQRMHMDYPNHYLTHPAPWTNPDAVTAILYLDDIEGVRVRACALRVALRCAFVAFLKLLRIDCTPHTAHLNRIPGVEGGTGVVPRRGEHDDNYSYPYTMMPGVGDIPWTNDRAQTEAHLAQHFPAVAAFRQGLYAHECSVHFSTGSLLLYRYDLWHRGRPIVPSARRIVMNLAWRKRSTAHFITSWQQGWAKSMQAASRALAACACLVTPCVQVRVASARQAAELCGTVGGVRVRID